MQTNEELGSEGGEKARENMWLGRSQQRHREHCQEVGSCSENRGSGSQKSNVIFIQCPVRKYISSPSLSSVGRNTKLFCMLALCTWQAQELHQVALAFIEACIF